MAPPPCVTNGSIGAVGSTQRRKEDVLKIYVTARGGQKPPASRAHFSRALADRLPPTMLSVGDRVPHRRL